jgi:hypothetical protein
MSMTKSTGPMTASGQSAAWPARRTRALAVVSAAAVTLIVWAIAGPLAGVNLQVQAGTATARHVGPALVAIAALLAGLAGWALLAAMMRFTPRARVIWTVTALVVLAVSLAGPLAGGVTTAAKLTLAAMHLAAAAVLIPALGGSAGPR